MNKKVISHTVCTRSSDSFNIVTHYMNWVTTSLTHCNKLTKIDCFHCEEGCEAPGRGGLVPGPQSQGSRHLCFHLRTQTGTTSKHYCGSGSDPWKNRYTDT